MDSVTIAKRPSVGTGWRIDKAVSTKRKNGKFFARAIDTGIVKQPAGKITQSRRTGSRSRKPPLYRRRAADYASLILLSHSVAAAETENQIIEEIRILAPGRA